MRGRVWSQVCNLPEVPRLTGGPGESGGTPGRPGSPMCSTPAVSPWAVTSPWGNNESRSTTSLDVLASSMSPAGYAPRPAQSYVKDREQSVQPGTAWGPWAPPAPVSPAPPPGEALGERLLGPFPARTADRGAQRRQRTRTAPSVPRPTSTETVPSAWPLGGVLPRTWGAPPLWGLHSSSC